MTLSVLVCTHNPRMDYLARVLQALKEQDLASSEWELLVIDNASARSVCEICDVSWHPNSRYVREEKLGLVPARLRGIRESTGSVLLFVDDDNVLQSDYLREALRIAREWPILGVWGGHVEGVFEVEPSSEVLEYLWMLGVRNVATVQWSNATFDNHAIPIGAGMCVRRPVALRYATAVTDSPYRQSLDRKGPGLVSGGDIDLALTACDAGLGAGRFPTLVVHHLIPRHRVEPEYIIRLAENIAYGGLLLKSVRAGLPSRIPFSDRIFTWYSILRQRGIRRAVIRAQWRGRVGVSHLKHSQFMYPSRTKNLPARSGR
jgi:glycosyltransferase involved in cell wall biosynthesis